MPSENHRLIPSDWQLSHWYVYVYKHVRVREVVNVYVHIQVDVYVCLCDMCACIHECESVCMHTGMCLFMCMFLGVSV